jgi:hypothetical protein
MLHSTPPTQVPKKNPGVGWVWVPPGSKKYNLEISANPSSFCVGSHDGVLVVLW